MKIGGFSYVRNGFEYGVPFIESILSVLPICDEFIIAIGDSTDGTRQAVENIASNKIKIIDTVWDMNQRYGGRVFAQQANIALDAVNADWAFHIQADEVMHEKDLPIIKEAMHRHNNNNEKIDGLLFPFLHFWGDYWHIQNSRRMHRHEIRVFKNNKYIRAYRDSQGFRIYQTEEGYTTGKEKGQKLRVKLLPAPIYHYSGVKNAVEMNTKAKNFHYFYGSDVEAKKGDEYNYHKVPRVAVYKGTHPAVMQQKIEQYHFKFEHDTTKAVWKTKDKLIQPIEDFLGIRFGEYKNYKLIK